MKFSSAYSTRRAREVRSQFYNTGIQVHLNKMSMLDLDVPALRGGKPIIVESEPDWYVKQVMEEFVVRAERIRGGVLIQVLTTS